MMINEYLDSLFKDNSAETVSSVLAFVGCFVFAVINVFCLIGFILSPSEYYVPIFVTMAKATAVSAILISWDYLKWYKTTRVTRGTKKG